MPAMSEHQVVIAGGGPTGLMLGAELQLAGVDVVIVERRADQSLDGSRAGGLHARTLEMFDMRGIVDRFIEAGQMYPTIGFAGMQLDMSDIDSRHKGTLALWQADIERILAEWVLDELGTPILRSREVVGFSDHEIALSDGSSLHADYLVGCDGGRSTVRKAAGIDFVGWDASSSYVIAELDLDDDVPLGMRPEGGGIGPVGEGRYRLTLREPVDDNAGAPSLDDVRSLLSEKFGSDFNARNASWVSRFTDASRQAAAYRNGHVFVAGDAAHVHAPHGGQGLNTGVQDALNLGWKLAAVLRGEADDSLLDSYHHERHPVAARVLRNTMAQVALSTTEDRGLALRELTSEFLTMDGPRRHVAGMISGLDIAYDLSGDHPLVGRRMPDLDLPTGRVYDLLRKPEFVCLELPEHTVVIRPDGYVAAVL